MAHTKLLDNTATEQLRAHLGAFLNSNPNPDFAKGPTFIGESFEVFELPASSVAPAAANPRGMTEYLHRTGKWYHQIVQNGVAVGIAYSGPARTFHGGWTIHSVFASPLAAKVARAIDIIDRQRPDDALEGIYVTIPAYKIVCFLLRGFSSEEIFVVSTAGAVPGLEEGKFYSARAFLNLLMQGKQIRGLGLNNSATLAACPTLRAYLRQD